MNRYVPPPEEIHILGMLMNHMINLAEEDGTGNRRVDQKEGGEPIDPYVYKIGRTYTLGFDTLSGPTPKQYVQCEHWHVNFYGSVTRITNTRGAKWLTMGDTELLYSDPAEVQRFKDDLMYIKLACG